MNDSIVKPDYLFETSWEVCNKVGGIHTVISTKTSALAKELNNHYILIGPDIWRDENGNPEFIEDTKLFKAWRMKAWDEGLRLKIGRWNITGKPVAVLVDFTSFFPEKDEIFKEFWETYKLDSISGQWDYIEPALFGYAAAKVIESFVNFNQDPQDKIVAQFHEWMTGIGILYLNEKVPWVATVFTTHATVLGRTIAGNNKPLYSQLHQYNDSRVAREFNVISKHSLEKVSAQTADVFTTVSEITAKECLQFLGKEVDIITPNGFEDTYVPQNNEFISKRKQARKKLLSVTNALLGYEVPENSIFTAISGRYEYKNKGIDVYIDALSKLNQSDSLTKDVIAFVLIPANHKGFRREVLEKIDNPSNNFQNEDPYLTHNLYDSDFDPVLKKIKMGGLKNRQEERVKIIFVPSYLNGKDGIFDMCYYDLLIGFDITVFPSYYEPWGYTPLESLAFHVPTITTSLAGFGRWVNDKIKDKGNGIVVVERKDDDYENVVDAIFRHMEYFSGLSEEDVEKARKKAYEISRIALWENLIKYYHEAFSIALKKAMKESDTRQMFIRGESDPVKISRPKVSLPVWNNLYIESKLPQKLERLNILSKNLWWSWNHEAEDLFKIINPVLWEECLFNPIVLLEKVGHKRLLALEKNAEFMAKLDIVYQEFQLYLNRKPNENQPKVAYFSMEYGLHNTLKIFSGGLGILAGDYLKEASDSGVDIVGIGLLYKYGFFKQILSLNGEQQASYEVQSFAKCPVSPVKDADGNWETISLIFPGRTLTARIWEVKIGKVTLYLLDTDLEANVEGDRNITHHLYGGDNENRLKQELLLGIGGIRALHKLGITPDLFHSNEGHSAFIGLERLKNLIVRNKFTFNEALEIVRSSTLFTTHTPVPAGHDAFDEDLLRTYIAHYPERLNISWDELMSFGRTNKEDRQEKFNMSFLAAALSQEINGVSKIHGQITREMFNKLWQGYLPEELHIGHVTNGVHFPTWIAREWMQVFDKLNDEDIRKNQTQKESLKKIYELKDEEIWDIKQKLKSKMISHLKERFKLNWIERNENPKHIAEITEKLNDNALTIGFARRFATYKRAHLLFKDTERLEKILNSTEKPVRFLFAGKAHPNDGGGKSLIKKVYEFSKKPEFIGKILFLQNYDIELAKKLIQGVDVWLNTPTRPLEASGTSGEKAIMNGTLHFSVLDGWWAEGYKPNAGWALTEKRTYDNQDFQDELDAETIYHLLENEIIPAFYKRDKNGVPKEWIGFIKKSMGEIAPDFTMKRMLTDYREKFYDKLFIRTLELKKDNYSMAKKLAAWKLKIQKSWDNIEVVSVNISNPAGGSYQLGEEYSGSVVVDLKDIPPSDVGLDLVVSDKKENGHIGLVHKQEFVLEKYEEGRAYFKVKIIPNTPCSFTYGFRLFPKHENLSHRQDFICLKWIS